MTSLNTTSDRRDNQYVYSRSDEARSWCDRALAPLTRDEAALLGRWLTDHAAPVLDCGCGAGRIAFNLERQGFQSVQGFDFSDEMLKAAEAARPEGSRVAFRLADATTMDGYADHAFGYTLYLQQIISLVPHDRVDDLLRHAIRVTRPGGLVVFSALNMDGRPINRALSRAVNTARLLWGEPRHPQKLPWLSFGARKNWAFLGPGQPTTYWFRRDELAARLAAAGLEVLEVTDSRRLQERADGPEGFLYAVCRTPA